MANTARRTRNLAAATAALTLCSACAGAGAGAAGGGGGGAEAAGGDAGGGRAPRTAVASGELAPARPPAPSYGGAPAGSCPSSAIVNVVMQDLTEANRQAGRAPPELDPRVCGVAEAFLGWDPAQGNPRAGVLAFVSSHYGLPVTVLPPSVASIGPMPAGPSSENANNQEVAQRIVQAIGDSVVNAVQPRVGIAVQRQRRGRNDVVFRVSVTLADVPLELDPLPRRLDAGQKATLSGRLLGGVRNPKVLVSDAQGRLSTPEQPAGEAFQAELACGDRPGRIMVEVRGEYQGSSFGVASFPVQCGQPLPTKVALAQEPWPTDPGAAERKILELVNEERAKAGLAPLQGDAAVANVAREISADLAARGGAAGGPDVGERLKKEGIGSPLVLQSAAAERSFERAHERLMASPTNRANIMNADVTHVGIGATPATDAAGRPLVYVTEVFVKELPPLDVEAVRQQLRDAVAQKRKDARTNALAQNPALDEVAQRYAEALAAAGGTLPKEKQSELTAPLNKAFKSVTMVSGAKQEALDFAEEPQTTAPGKALGVGAAQGRHPVLGRNATFVVLMVGTPRK